MPNMSLMRAPEPTICAMVYVSTVRMPPMAQATRTGPCCSRNATTSENVNLPRVRSGSAMRDMSAGQPTPGAVRWAARADVERGQDEREHDDADADRDAEGRHLADLLRHEGGVRAEHDNVPVVNNEEEHEQDPAHAPALRDEHLEVVRVDDLVR